MTFSDNLPTVYVGFCALAMIIVGLWHLVQGERTELLFKQPRYVRLAGAALLLLSAPCFIWRGPYFLLLGAILGLSGALRLFAAKRNIALQKTTLPRRGHGCVILVAGVLIWLAYQLLAS